MGEEKDPDPDPIIRLDVSDCTVHVLTSLAFAQSDSWDKAKDNMIRIHYKDHQPNFTTRWHFTSDRILSHPQTIDITKTLLPIENLKRANLTLNKKEIGGELLDLNWEREVETHYVPNTELNINLLNKLPGVCGAAFVKKSLFELGIILSLIHI